MTQTAPVAAPAAQPAVLFEMIGPHIALVTLNRPDKRNAVNGDVATGLEAAVKRTEADPEVRVVILTSSQDKVFCAGADLAAIAAGRGAETETALGGFAGFVYATRTKPWIAAVEGLALGGGFEICLACDMMVAGHDARFGLPETKRGLMAGAGGVHRLASRVPAAIAFEIIASGEPVDAARAFSLGLVNRLAEPGTALAAARDLADRIVPNAPLAVQYALAAARHSIGQTDGAGRAIASDWFALLRKTEDYHEGPRAFVEKRDPVWTGR